MQTLLPDCSVRKLQPVNADIEKIYAMASQNTLYYQYHPPFVIWAEHFERYVRIAARQNDGRQILYWLFYGAALVAVVDMILAYPDETTGYIGFFHGGQVSPRPGDRQPYRGRHRKYYAQQWYAP